MLEDQLINADRRWLGYMQKTQRPHKCIDESILQNAVHEEHQNERAHKNGQDRDFHCAQNDGPFQRAIAIFQSYTPLPTRS